VVGWVRRSSLAVVSTRSGVAARRQPGRAAAGAAGW
jgi:hypothetical protein